MSGGGLCLYRVVLGLKISANDPTVNSRGVHKRFLLCFLNHISFLIPASSKLVSFPLGELDEQGAYTMRSKNNGFIQKFI